MEVAIVGTVKELKVRRGEKVRTAIRLDGIPATILVKGELELPIGQALKVKGRLASEGDGRLTLWAFDVAGLCGPIDPVDPQVLFKAFFTAQGTVEGIEQQNGYPVVTLNEQWNGRGDRHIIALPGFTVPDAMRGKRVQVQGRVQFREEEDECLHTRTRFDTVGLKLNLLTR